MTEVVRSLLKGSLYNVLSGHSIMLCSSCFYITNWPPKTLCKLVLISYRFVVITNCIVWSNSKHIKTYYCIYVLLHKSVMFGKIEHMELK